MMAKLSTLEGSTVPVSLMRIGMALVAWAEWARALMPSTNLTTEQLLIGASFYLSTLAMLVGFFSRASAAWAGLSMAVMSAYYAAVLGKGAFAHHHSYLIIAATLLLALTPCGGSFSLDRWWALRRAAREGRPAPPARGNLWAVRLIALQLSAAYFWGAYHKASSWSFVTGARLEQITMSLYFGSDYPGVPGFHVLMLVTAWLTIVLEFVLAFGLWSTRWQRFLMPVGIGFHLLIYYLFPVSTFTVSMCLLYLAYLQPDAVHEAVERLTGSAVSRRPAGS